MSCGIVVRLYTHVVEIVQGVYTHAAENVQGAFVANITPFCTILMGSHMHALLQGVR